MDVLQGRVSGQRFQDKVVLIGAYAPSLRDRFYTPFSHYQGTTPKPMYGVEIQALLTSQIIQAALLEAGGIRGVAQLWESEDAAFRGGVDSTANDAKSVN